MLTRVFRVLAKIEDSTLDHDIDSICTTLATNLAASSCETAMSGVNESVITHSRDMNTSAAQGVMSELPVSVYLRTVTNNPSTTTSNSSFCRQIAEANNMVAIPVGGDGSCQYYAILEGLKAMGRTLLMTVKELRRLVHKEIVTNRDRYESFVDSTVGPLVTYARGILGKQWGDEITLKAMTYILRINIEVIRFDCNGQYIPTNVLPVAIGNEDPLNTIYLTLDDRHELTAHYGALIPREQQTRFDVQQHGETPKCSSGKKANQLSCRFCGRPFKTKIGLKSHIRHRHSEMLIHDELSSESDTLRLSNYTSSYTDSVARFNENIEGQIDENDVWTDRDILSDTSSVVSELSVSTYSETSSRTDQNVFKVPKMPSTSGQQCQICGEFFKKSQTSQKV
jgi:OTU-like cysteine protease